MIHQQLCSFFIGLLLLISVGCGERNIPGNKPQPPKFISTTAVSTERKVDSNFLVVQFADDKYQLVFQGETTFVKNAEDVSDFLRRNKSLIDTNKIMVGQFVSTNPAPLLTALKQNGFRKFFIKKKVEIHPVHVTTNRNG